MFTYGILTVIFTLEHFESIEDYEECKIIMEAIKEQERYLNCKLPSKYSKEAMDMVIETYKSFGLTGRNAEINHREYALQFISKIEVGDYSL